MQLVFAVKLTVRRFPRNSSPGKVAPAIKVIVWDCVFSALGSQRPFWQPETFLGAFLSRFESVESGALFRKNKRFTREGSKKRGLRRARQRYSLRVVHFLEQNKRFSREGSKKRGLRRARQRYSLRVVHFLEKTSVLVERGRKNVASAEHGGSIH
jgi:hypothetical protein